MSDTGEQVAAWLIEARQAREQRDRDQQRWLTTVVPILRSLRAAGVPYRRIAADTGISLGTLSRLIGPLRRTGTSPK